MADERLLNLVKFVVGYFDTGTLNKTSGCITYFVATFNFDYSGPKLAAFELTQLGTF
ncbi:hypothetical protein [Lactiplantibacillus plantarum]|uniref:hypothetical protein n=1 Tax=Lactiplantibacillus plantarum TaxID=1590 RepID=UPI000305F7E6|nr:hypothetical protein [Lactiplantibacillus plantarum]KFL91492.1 hypothetical protein LpDm1_0457 [Lactiplantibacillus plantarum]KZU21384.1 hypothetical protein CNW10_0441 [Lactiplantibacillus plantarum]